MNILVTGGTGFIGSHLVPRLLKEGHTVALTVRPQSKTHSIFTTYPVKPVDTNLKALKTYFHDSPPDAIMHLATFYIKKHQLLDIPPMIETNITFPSLLLELATAHGTQAFLNTGTCFEYQLSDQTLNETSPLQPYNLYAATKVAFEDIVKHTTQVSALKAVTLKLFYPYGEGDKLKVIPLMLNSLFNNQELHISRGEQVLDYTYVEDIVEAFIKALAYSTSASAPTYDHFNIGTGQGSRLKDIAQLFNTLHGKELIYCDREYAPQEIMHMLANNTKARTLLKWAPQTDTSKGIENIYRYYQAQGGSHD